MPPDWLWPRSAYVHIPFCAHHCGYCDFAVAVGRDDQMDLYLAALETELAQLREPRPVKTLFLGGGTPTYLDQARIERLLVSIARWLPLESGHEFSVEANPGTLDAGKIGILADHGVNRLSLGAQSFHPEILRVLERDHQVPDVARAVETARQHIAHVSLDLIFGVPGQTPAAWAEDIRQALALEPSHISTYGLTYEKGTRLWKQKQRSEIQALNEATELAMYELAMDRLEAAGFDHYEISSFARPGCQCRHNQVYWANHAHWGFGLGAARYVEGVRSTNTRDLTTYIRRLQRGQSPVFQSEQLPPLERARETMSVQLRRATGVDRPEFLQQTGIALDALAGPAVARLVQLGLLHDDGTRIFLTRPGQCVADSVIAELM
jgi:oxygen-independent coproporphyrinogen-3 oxidase